MKINEKKSKIMMFNKSRNLDFPPEFSFKNGELIECVDETRLLGIQIHKSLRWDSNCLSIFKRSMSKMWLLRRMKSIKLEKSIILEYYLKEIRPLSEQGVIVWNSGLTKAQVRQLENIQKVALKIILNNEYSDYLLACKTSGISTLSSRRAQLCSNFAVKLYKTKRCEEYFTKLHPKTGTRNLTKIVKEITVVLNVVSVHLIIILTD